MYTVSVTKDFIAQHFLVGGEWGDENLLHSHHYEIELQLKGASLDKHGYLVDIVEIESQLSLIIENYQDRTLNDMPEFENLNPSIENFSRIVCEKLNSKIGAQNIEVLLIVIRENNEAWASYQITR